MTINRIGHVEPVQPGKKPGRSEPVGGIDRKDTINLSSEAIEKAELYQIVEMVKAAPEMDDARIAELRQKINDPAYVNEKIINAAAENMLNSWFA
jgi:negative regulator of flagellin synthesis FlgM